MKFGATNWPVASMIFSAVEMAGRRDRGDMPARDHDVALEDFAGMQRQHLAAAHDEVRPARARPRRAQVHQFGDARREIATDEGGLR